MTHAPTIVNRRGSSSQRTHTAVITHCIGCSGIILILVLALAGASAAAQSNDQLRLLFHSYDSFEALPPGDPYGGDLYLYDLTSRQISRITSTAQNRFERHALMSPNHRIISVSVGGGTVNAFGLMLLTQSNQEDTERVNGFFGGILPLLWGGMFTQWESAAWSPHMGADAMTLAFSTNQIPDVDFHEWSSLNIWTVQVPTRSWSNADLRSTSPSDLIPPLGDTIMATRSRLTDGDANDTQVAWSPDGAHIAFVSDRDDNLEIYTLDTDGTNRNLRRLTDNLASDHSPAWSPDGQSLVFVSERDGNSELYRLRVADGSLQRLTNNPSAETVPSWSPDGQFIVFLSDGIVTLMRPDGSDWEELFAADDVSWVP